jgi:hypothetical protein
MSKRNAKKHNKTENLEQENQETEQQIVVECCKLFDDIDENSIEPLLMLSNSQFEVNNFGVQLVAEVQSNGKYRVGAILPQDLDNDEEQKEALVQLVEMYCHGILDHIAYVEWKK